MFQAKGQQGSSAESSPTAGQSPGPGLGAGHGAPGQLSSLAVPSPQADPLASLHLPEREMRATMAATEKIETFNETEILKRLERAQKLANSTPNGR